MSVLQSILPTLLIIQRDIKTTDKYSYVQDKKPARVVEEYKRFFLSVFDRNSGELMKKKPLKDHNKYCGLKISKINIKEQ